MVSCDVIVSSDAATQALDGIRRGLGNDQLLPVLGRSVTNAVRGNFDDLEASRPNKLGGTRQHYYSGARAATAFTVEGDSAIVAIRQVGMRLRYYGGTVKAGAHISSATGQPTKYLTIPATAEAYGHRAADFPELEVLWGRNGPYALGRVERKTISRGDSFGSKAVGSEVLFWLRKSVDIPADKTMLPGEGAIRDAVTEDFGKYMRMLWRREGAQGSN